jgi:hypothetical protein
VKNGGRNHRIFLKQRAPCFIVLVLVTVLVSIPIAVAVTINFTMPENSLEQKEVGGSKVEGRPNSTILAVEGSWQS